MHPTPTDDLSPLDSSTPASQPVRPMPCHGSIVAVDYGEKRLGVAYSDPDQQFVLNAKTVNSPAELVLTINEVASRYTLAGIVLGLPRHLNGSEGQSAQTARALGDTLQTTFEATPVAYFDERLTSKWAEGELQRMGHKPSKKKGLIDTLAAHRILDDFLRSRQFPTF